MNQFNLGLFGRLFLLFSVTTVLLATSITLGVFSLSEQDAKHIILERHDSLHDMLSRTAVSPINKEKLIRDAKANKVQLLVSVDGHRWSSAELFPTIDTLRQSSQPIGKLLFAKHEHKYYLLAQNGNNWAAITSNIANLIVYPNWLVYWPWCFAVVVLVSSYLLLKKLIKPIKDAINSANVLSQGQLDHRITEHPKTELSQLTRGLNAMAHNLSQLFEAQNELLLAISHELRTPMARMKVSLAMLPENQTVKDLGDDITQMDNLIEQLLEGERLKRGYSVLDVSSHYLPVLIDELLQEPIIKDRVTLQDTVPELAVRLDVGRIKFLLRNLLKNAVEHSPSNALVSIRVTRRNETLIFDVTDQGPGIAQALQEKVFEPFFQVTSISHRSTSGLGLGLYLCKKIALAHNGSLTVSNNADKGCSFCLTLPGDCIKS
ncbi:hypothetical protein PA25_25440 [Pseudoalteromonas sp. A25]|uniref:HAMP domain-containing sensor histidine kinase n=1 Tax=Pseudoalteromonas sp. A25 TaxID=116092 RepID=UPI0012610583|nr:HAMP domain-containing sensor histidine kinase [Pseudoalteromonas sp. A25]BBN82559.1 hypothetical protein PA25_25440 [Pseudoalteromonas sp. A25]